MLRDRARSDLGCVVSLPGVRGDYCVGLNFFFPVIFWKYFIDLSDALKRICRGYGEQLLEGAVVYSVAAFGEGFP